MTFLPIISGFNPLDLGLLFVFVLLGSLGAPTGFVAVVSSGAIAGDIGKVIILIIVSALGAIAGDILAYEIARKFSFLREKLQKYKFYSKGEPKARALLNKYVFFSVFITRFLFIGLGAIVSYLSGFEKLNRRKYLMAVISGEILFAAIFTIVGYVFRLVWNDLIGFLNYFMAALTALGVALVILIIIRRKRKKAIKEN
jgi:membrane protein DedA with SNARE-associated domain